ncbi:uncharacterized protein LOC142240172 [Haematobia irritans]|uniref:uncharacterized protein LOC142240172 n=1 Tax=Haematobia irritans TaxID=7368 RepID=UPI003F502D4F
MGGRATLYSFRPQNKAEWCNVLGLDPNKIHSKHGVCSDHFLTHTERLAYGNPSEMMEDYVPLEHLAINILLTTNTIRALVEEHLRKVCRRRKVCLSYDEINVTVDIDDDTRLCRIFALNGIGSDWQCILSYDIIENGLNTIGRLKNSIAQRIYVAYECGFDVICVSADQCPISQKLYSICKTFNSGDNFKAKYLSQLSSCNPLDKQIWFIPDLTHLLIGITNAILKGHFDVDCDMITRAKNFYPEACVNHFRPKGYYYGIRDFEAVQNVFSNGIINKIKEIEPESEIKAKTVEFLERMKAFVECFSNLSRDNYESVLNEWIIFFNSHGCSKVKSCLSGFKFIADDFFNCNEDIYSIDMFKNVPQNG